MIEIELDLSGSTAGDVGRLANMLESRFDAAGLAEVGAAIATPLRDGAGADLVRVTIPMEVDDGTSAPVASRWYAVTGVLEKLNRTVRAAYLDAQPEMSGSTLVLWFRYGFHHKKAQEQSSQLLPLVREWLGNGVKVDYRLREAAPESARPTKAASAEDDPFVREVVRRFDGRVTRVKEISE